MIIQLTQEVNMAISKETINFLFDIMNFYDEQYNKIADNCYNEMIRALNEICSKSNQSIKVVPFGSYAIKSNYQVFEPMEFFCILDADRNILQKETDQKSQLKKGRKRSLKNLYQQILQSQETNLTALETAKNIATELQKYISAEDKITFKNNVILVKFNVNEEIKLSIIIYVGYNFDNDDIVEYTKLGFGTRQNLNKNLYNIQQKNLRTNGNYLVLCKLIKMLELELILADKSNINLSAKTLFVENVLYNVPDKFFMYDEFSEIFTQITNYLNQCKADDFYIPDDTNTNMFKEHGYYANKNFLSFVKKLSYICLNADVMIYDALNAMQENSDDENIDKNENNSQTNNDESQIVKINKNID